MCRFGCVLCNGAVCRRSIILGGITIKITLSKRLAAIASEIHHKSIIDIGTDHAHIPIYTCLNGITNKAVACDINSGPLETAKKNIKTFRLEHMIETRLCSGFDAVKPNEAECAILAGMGGGLIIDILKNASAVVSAFDSLILQPQLDIPEVRRYIHIIGFKISKELIVEDSSKFYNIISCEKGTDTNYTEAEYLIGKKLIEQASETFKKYLNRQLISLRKIEANIGAFENTLDDSGRKRLAEIQKFIKMYQCVLNPDT